MVLGMNGNTKWILVNPATATQNHKDKIYQVYGKEITKVQQHCSMSKNRHSSSLRRNTGKKKKWKNHRNWKKGIAFPLPVWLAFFYTLFLYVESHVEKGTSSHIWSNRGHLLLPLLSPHLTTTRPSRIHICRTNKERRWPLFSFLYYLVYIACQSNPIAVIKYYKLGTRTCVSVNIGMWILWDVGMGYQIWEWAVGSGNCTILSVTVI